MEIISYFTIKPIILLFEILFIVFGRIYGTNIVVLLVCITSGILFSPLFYAANSRLNDSFPKKAKLSERIREASYPLLFFIIHLVIFMATVSFVLSVNIIAETSFGPIADLSLPDGLIKSESFSINILPFFFLTLSVLSIAVNKAKSPAHRIYSATLYVVLTILLYFSPAGVNLFWISYACINLITTLLVPILSKAMMNNSTIGIANKLSKSNVTLGLLKAETGRNYANNFSKKKNIRKPDCFLFTTGIVYLIILTGIFIPTNIMKVSAAEFVEVLDVKNPLHYIFYSFAYALGSFGIWFITYYYLARNHIRILFDRLVWIVSVMAFINLILAGSYLGEISPGLFYYEFREFDYIRIIIDTVLSVIIGILVYILIEKKKDFMRILVIAELVIIIISSTLNCIRINNVYKGLDYLTNEKGSEDIIHLNKNAKNVVVLIMDRALGSEVPYIFNEKPELKNQFDGFIYYPNTISFGGYTNTGIPSVYGGYEYTPDKINERINETLEEKHNEALKVMPVLFDENGYDVTVCDPAYAGYNWIPDLSIYNEYKTIRTYNTDGKFNNYASNDFISQAELLKRDFFVHSLMKIAPFNWQLLLYNEGLYCNPNLYISQGNSIYQSKGYDYDFLNAYLVLTNLHRITSISESDKKCFLLFYNATPHMPCLLQEPDYIPQNVVDNREYHQNDSKRFSVNGKVLPMGTSMELKSYCENDCYNNTRIILVSDHGRDVHFSDTIGDSKVECEFFMPVLLVKDFNAHGFTTSDELMTNADVITLATAGLIDNPTNPFTGTPINSDAKNTEKITVFYSDKCNLEDNHGNTFVPGKWFTVHDNPYNIENWNYIGEY